MENGRGYYVKTDSPDKDKLAELLEAAIGGRTKQQFAKLCGVQPSTITRILQKTNKGASTDELIRAIAKNASPLSGVTLASLMVANGMTYRSENGYNRDFGKHEDTVQKIVFNELLARGADIRLGNIRYNVSKSLCIKPDILLMTNAFGVADQIWMMEIIPPYLKHYENQSEALPSGKILSLVKSKAFQVLSRFSFLSMSGNETFQPVRFSIITTERPIFDCLAEEFSEICVPVYISLICINLDDEKIGAEFVFRQSNGETCNSFFMSNPVIVPGTERIAIDDDNLESGIDDASI